MPFPSNYPLIKPSALKKTLEKLGRVNDAQNKQYKRLNSLGKLDDIHSAREAKESINLILELEVKKEVLLDMAAILALDTDND
jgi:hypothetical protein